MEAKGIAGWLGGMEVRRPRLPWGGNGGSAGVMTPRVSVLTTLYNCRRFIGAAVESVLGQSEGDWEMVVCDDGSSDGSAEVVEAVGDPRVRLVRHAENMGVTAALRTCARAARGKYFAVLESDDVAMPGRLKRQAEWLDGHPEADAVFGRAELIGEDGAVLAADDEFRGVFAEGERTREEWLRWFFEKGNCLCWSTVMYRREMYERTGVERAAFQLLPDFDLWVRLALRGRFGMLEETVTAYRRLAGSLSVVTPERLAAIAAEQAAVLRHFASAEGVRAVTGRDDSGPLARLELARMALGVPSVAHRAFAVELLLETDLSGSGEEETAEFLRVARPILRESDVYQKLKVARLSRERDKYREQVAARRQRS